MLAQLCRVNPCGTGSYCNEWESLQSHQECEARTATASRTRLLRLDCRRRCRGLLRRWLAGAGPGGGVGGQ